jgi:WD40-like Beta Propeller Repeat
VVVPRSHRCCPDGSGAFEPAQGPPGPLSTSWATGAGGAAASMVASAEEVAIWTDAVFRGSLLDPRARSLVDRGEVWELVGHSPCNSRGIGFGLDSVEGRDIRPSNGGMPGFRSALAYFQHEGITVVALGNAGPGLPIEQVRDALARTVLAAVAPSPTMKMICNVDVYLVGAKGGSLERLTVQPTIDGTPVPWSPDGKTILFSSNRDGDPEVYAMDADGSHQRNLTRHPANDFGSRSWMSSRRTTGTC